ncbi:hypothetical protein L0V05_06285 [Tabrizicola sp. J26]|uniref:ATP-grasp fold amidoligase family protein n=1 Tax=Alitabrizicola rongguiensis TaxID=2909234 RepID=UPI002104C29B|nr:ATP-grasp fold amidoligase family protein [Tabrizicola rongguiensis]MCF1708422.1 hypothetical protein [Tabrizicola rongguiensis]
MNLSSIGERLSRLLPDEFVVRRDYRRRVGRPLDLANPKGFHEKICWLRLRGLTPLHSYCADKITAAAYVASIAGPGLTTPRYFRTTDPQMLSAESIPVRSCVIKPNHASQLAFVLPDTAAADWPHIRRKLAASLNRSFYWDHRERQYLDIPPAVIVEELVDQSALDMGEINIYCLNGIARFAVTFKPGAILAEQKGILVDRDCRPLAVSRLRRPTAQGEVTPPRDFNRIRETAEALARPFALCRVDILLGQDQFFVSELTFSPLAGYESFDPLSFELEMGQQLDLNAPLPDWRPILAAAKAMEPQVLPPWK